MTGPVLGLDLGARRIGLALSDDAGKIAFPAGYLDRSGLERDLQALLELIQERRVTQVVVGLPLHLDGGVGVGARAARQFADALARATDRPVELVDERLTTVEAERALQGAPRSKRRKRKEVIDSMAATLLLRTYLEQAESRP
jgi:putative Holliday junction resolvase